MHEFDNIEDDFSPVLEQKSPENVLSVLLLDLTNVDHLFHDRVDDVGKVCLF